jgi:hypothetical protein
MDYHGDVGRRLDLFSLLQYNIVTSLYGCVSILQGFCTDLRGFIRNHMDLHRFVSFHVHLNSSCMDLYEFIWFMLTFMISTMFIFVFGDHGRDQDWDRGWDQGRDRDWNPNRSRRIYEFGLPNQLAAGGLSFRNRHPLIFDYVSQFWK